MRQKLGVGWLMVAVLAWCLLGCGGRSPKLPPLVPVEGVVTLDGQPLEEAYVQFHPVGTTRGTGAASNTDAEGRYELIAPDRSKGAPVGEYRVVISKLVLPDGTPFRAEDGAGPMDSPGREMLPARFSDYEQSVLTVMVPEGGGKIDLPLVSKR
ncbi:MAG: hypothetical protein RBS80_11040 [Thermoguttaceae bacterium]|jgi:hypothetical protein|nr:hypothetical protein [Thermoguttaceae bacterium]